MKKVNSLIIIFILGLLFRLFISVQIYSGDVNNHIAWGKDALRFGLSGIYERSFTEYGVMTPTYPPIPIFFFTFFYWLFQTIYHFAQYLNNSIPAFPSNMIWLLEDQDVLPAFLKIPAIFADLGIAYFIYLIAKDFLGEKAKKWILVFPCLILFNPAFFYNSAYWGQIEAVPLLFIVSSFYFLFLKRKMAVSILLLTLALLTKQSVIVFLPIFFVGFFSVFNIKKMTKRLLLSIVTFFAFFFPFYEKGNFLIFPFSTYINKIQTGSGSNYVTDHAFNFWALLTGLVKIPDTKPFWLGINYVYWGYFFFGAFVIFVLYFLLKNRKKMLPYVYALFLIPFASFLLLTKMHERYLEQALPFLLIMAVKKKIYLTPFIILCFVNLINLYHNWWAPNSLLLRNILSQITAINMLIFIEIGIFIYFCVRYVIDIKNENSNY